VVVSELLFNNFGGSLGLLGRFDNINSRTFRPEVWQIAQ
jgi:hypothetical protein